MTEQTQGLGDQNPVDRVERERWLIEQPFLEDDTGGFLWIEVRRDDNGSNLTATWVDEFATPRHRWTPPPRP